MTFRELDSVVLVHDEPEHTLRSGDVGTIVHVHSDDAFDVEFISASGLTIAVIELTSADIGQPTDDDQLAVRSRVRPALAK